MTDTVAVDREALATWLYRLLPPEVSYARADELAGDLIASGILRDVRKVQHDHDERIADAVMPKLVEVYGTNGFPVRLLRQALGYVISPAPDR